MTKSPNALQRSVSIGQGHNGVVPVVRASLRVARRMSCLDWKDGRTKSTKDGRPRLCALIRKARGDSSRKLAADSRPQPRGFGKRVERVTAASTPEKSEPPYVGCYG